MNRIKDFSTIMIGITLLLGFTVTTFLPLYALTTNKLIINDSLGDDKGPGYYEYQGNKTFKLGIYDIAKFELLQNNSYVLFKVYLRNLGSNSCNAPNGFCLQNIQIYIRTTEKNVPAREDTFGLNIVLRSDYAWHLAVVLVPGWGNEPYPLGSKSVLYYSNGTVITQNNYTFKINTDIKNNAIIAKISKKLLFDLSHIPFWKIVVVVTGYSNSTPMKVKEIKINTSALENQTEINRIKKAISESIEPKAMDLAVYSPKYSRGITTKQQYFWLNNFDVSLKTLATIPPQQAITLTKTITQTLIQTYTYHHTIHHTHTITVTKRSSETFILGVLGISIAVIFAGLALIYLASRQK